MLMRVVGKIVVCDQLRMNPLIQELQTKATGEHIHTINKACYYLEKLDKDPEKYKSMKDNLESLVKSALCDNQWHRVREFMARWW